MSDIEADISCSRAVPAQTGQMAGSTVTDHDLAALVDHQDALIDDPPAFTTASAYEESEAPELLPFEQEMLFISETCHSLLVLPIERA